MSPNNHQEDKPHSATSERANYLFKPQKLDAAHRINKPDLIHSQQSDFEEQKDLNDDEQSMDSINANVLLIVRRMVMI